MWLNRDTVKRLGSSRFNYWFGYVANLTLVGWLISRAWQDGTALLSWPMFLTYACLGLLSWTLSEYLLHRYVYHVWPSFLSTGHDLHHQNPKALIGVPWYLTSMIIVALYELLAYVGHPAVVGVLMAFNWLGYIGYCIAHHGSHHWRCSGFYLRRMKQHHLLHHAYPQYNWGFTTALWDVVFRTYLARTTKIHSKASSSTHPA